MRIKIDIKFTEKSLDRFADQIWRELTTNPQPSFLFDFSETEWISNEELVVFSSFLKYFKTRKIPFTLQFIEPGTDITKMPERVAKQLIQLWDIWKIYQILEENPEDFIGFAPKGIEKLKEKYNYYPAHSEIFDRFGITPFIKLEKVSQYQDKAIQDILTSVYRLNQATREILKKYNSEHPFISNTISHIISKELYENFLDHFEPSLFGLGNDHAFMSLCLRTKLNENKHSKETIQRVLRTNFESEAPVEYRDFFYDKKKREFKNQNVIQFSFIDFGKGIVSTLTNSYISDNKKPALFGHNDSEILAYAFRHDSSRHGIFQRNTNRNVFIPRGLFDVLSIVKMYKGMLYARSAFGKLLFDFSDNKDFDQAITVYPTSDHYFPGTLISVYIPTENRPEKHQATSIKPVIDYEKSRPTEIRYLNLFQIINEVRKNKKDIYSDLIEGIRRKLPRDKKSYTIFFSFRGFQYDPRLAKKALFFLLSDYDINLRCNIVIVHPPEKEIVEEIHREIADLSLVEKTYKIHPLPLIYFSEHLDDLKVVWLGIFQQDDISKLNDLLSGQFSLAISDFLEPGNVVGNINYFDEKGNLKSHFPERSQFIEYYRTGYKELDEEEIRKLLEKNHCLTKPGEYLYLCHGNYYQKEFIEIIHLLNNAADRDFACEILFRNFQEAFIKTNEFKFIGITSSSHKIIDSFIRQGFISPDSAIFLNNYYSFDSDSSFNSIQAGTSYCLVCDVISTGFLARRLRDKLIEADALLKGILVLVNTIDESFENSKEFLNEFETTLVSLLKYPITKFRRNSPTVQKYLKTNAPVRINPFTNLSVTLNVSDTISQSILVSTDYFLENIDDDAIKMGFLYFNDVIHPYFFDTRKIIEQIDQNFLKHIFEKIRLNENNLNVFYPRESGIQFLDFVGLSNEIFKNHSVSYYQLERFRTPEGWRFPHATDYFATLNKSKTILILDDGSCTGDSILQMIDEIAFSEAKNIILLCLVGRISDHKREFFSRISEIRGPNDKKISIEIYFVCHWHIPTYYIDENPNLIERRWLENVIELSNTPERIRSIAKTINRAITPRHLTDFIDYKYLPRLRNEDRNIPKKEILRVREEIGKIIGYRFYKESFEYFDGIIKIYEGLDRTNRNKEMELLCATFLYEPYLYNKISIVLPDIIDKIEEFVDALIFGNPRREHRLIDIDKDLYYHWDKKDIIHLFFIVYHGSKLFQKLNEYRKFEKIITYLDNKDQSINYVVYKLLAYFPLNKSELIHKNPGQLLHLIDILLQQNILSPKDAPTLKIFRSFVGTLPKHNDYYSQLSSIQEYYRIMKDSTQHKHSVLAHYDKLMVDLEVMKVSFENVVFSEFEESWKIVSTFIETLLAFSSSFPGFFLTKLSIVEGYSEGSLRVLHGQLNELLNNLGYSSDFENIQSNLRRIKEKLLMPEAVVTLIFSQIITVDAVPRIINLIKKSSGSDLIEFDNQIEEELTIDLPFYHLDEIILKEIISNFRHSDENKIKITFANPTGKLEVTISNIRSDNNRQGGGYGLAMLEKLKSFPNSIIRYHNNGKEPSTHFIQKLQIKTI